MTGQSPTQSFIVDGQDTNQHMSWLVAIADCQSFIVVGQDTYQHMSCPVAIADCAHVQQVTASFKDLVTVALERELYKDTH